MNTEVTQYMRDSIREWCRRLNELRRQRQVTYLFYTRYMATEVEWGRWRHGAR